MEIIHRIPTVEEYTHLRKAVGWWDTDRDATKKALSKSLFSVVAIEGDTAMGFGRIIGDGGLYFYIQDLIVHPDFQGKGIGKVMMQELMTYIKSSAKPGSYIALLASKGRKEFYKQFEFEARDADAPGMYQVVK